MSLKAIARPLHITWSSDALTPSALLVVALDATFRRAGGTCNPLCRLRLGHKAGHDGSARSLVGLAGALTYETSCLVI